MRLIDANALKKKMIADADTYILSDGIRHGYHNCERLVEDAPTIEERKTGRWIVRETASEDTEAKCSECGFVTLINEPGNGLHMLSDLHYCPKCGSFNVDMHQEGEDNGQAD